MAPKQVKMFNIISNQDMQIKTITNHDIFSRLAKL